MKYLYNDRNSDIKDIEYLKGRIAQAQQAQEEIRQAQPVVSKLMKQKGLTQYINVDLNRILGEALKSSINDEKACTKELKYLEEKNK